MKKTPNSVALSFLNQKNVTGGQIAKRLKVSPALVYRSLEGTGSRWLRVRIAVFVRKPPSTLWPELSEDQLVLDDHHFVNFLQSGLDPLTTPKPYNPRKH
jgi:hypothetical protein